MSRIKLLKGSVCVFLTLSIVALLSVNVRRVEAIDIRAFIVTLYPCDNAGARETEFDQMEIVYVCGSGFEPNEELILRVMPNGMGYMACNSVRNVTARASGDGHLGPVALGTLPPGKYDIWADRNKNGWLEPGEPAAGFGFCYIGFLVVPEYLFGTILGLAGCFGAFGVFRLSKHRRK